MTVLEKTNRTTTTAIFFFNHPKNNSDEKYIEPIYQPKISIPESLMQGINNNKIDVNNFTINIA